MHDLLCVDDAIKLARHEKSPADRSAGLFKGKYSFLDDIHARCDVGVVGRVGGMGQLAVQLVHVQFFFPFRHDDGGHAVADEVGQRAAFAHEAVDAQDQRHAGHGNRRHHGQGGGQGDEAGAGDAGSTFRRQHRHAQDGQFLHQGQFRVGCLGNEQGGHRHVDVGAVQVERITGRHHQADHRLGGAQALQLRHQGRQGAFRRARTQHDQQFFLDVGDEAEDREAGKAGNGTEHDEDEQAASQVERTHQLGQRQQRIDAVFADGEGHRAEGTDRGDLHDDIDHAEDGAAGLVDQLGDRAAFFTQQRQREAEQDGDQQHLQDVALGEGIDDGVRDDVHHEVDRAQAFDVRVLRNQLDIEVGRVGVEAGAWFQDVSDQQANCQRESGDYFEVEQGLAADAADFLDVLHAGDTGHNSTEDHWGNDHLDQFDEAVTQRFHVDGVGWVKYAQQHADDNGEYHLYVQDFIKWFFHEWSPLAG